MPNHNRFWLRQVLVLFAVVTWVQVSILAQESQPDLARVADAFKSGAPDARFRIIAESEWPNVPPATAVSLLLPVLHDPDPKVRWAAAWALGEVKAEPKRVVPALMEMAGSDKECLVEGCPLKIHPPPNNELSRGARITFERRDRGYQVRIAAIQALASFSPDADDAVPLLVRLCRAEDIRVRWYAIGALVSIGPRASAAVPELVQQLRSKDVAAGEMVTSMWGHFEDGPIRLVAAVALGRIGPDARTAIPDLVQLLRDPNARVVEAVARALGQIGTASRVAILALARLVRESPDEFVRSEAVEAMGGIGVAAVPVLILFLHGQDPERRCLAARALLTIGPGAAKAAPELLRALTDPDPFLRAAAAQALGEIGPVSDRVIPALVVALKDQDQDVWSAALDALKEMGSATVPAILSLLRDHDPEVRNHAVATLVELGTVGTGLEEMPAVRERFKHRAIARRRLLRAALADPDERVRTGAAEALEGIGSEAVPDLVAALDDPSPVVRVGAAQTLELIGSDAKAALEALRQHCSDPDPQVRQAVAAASRAISESKARQE